MRSVLWRLVLGFVLILPISPTLLRGQVAANALKGQGVAIYVSQRGLEFTGAYTILFGAYVARQDTLGVIEEDLRRGVSIKLGTFLCDALPRYLGATGCTFVNADADLGPAFVRANVTNELTGSRLNVSAVRDRLPAATRYVLVIDGLELHSEERIAVYSISNRIVSEKRIARLGRIRLKLYDAASGTLTAQTDLVYDDERSANQHAYFRLSDGAAGAELFFARIFNAGFADLFKQVAGQP